MNVGKLYKFNKYYWLLYPSKETARVSFIAYPSATGTMVSSAEEVSDWVAYFNNKLNCNVSYVSPNSIFCFLEKEYEYCKLLTTNGELGWIIYPEDAEWTKDCIEEVTP